MESILKETRDSLLSSLAATETRDNLLRASEDLDAPLLGQVVRRVWPAPPQLVPADSVREWENEWLTI